MSRCPNVSAIRHWLLAGALCAGEPSYATQLVTLGGAPCDYGVLQAALDHAHNLAVATPADPVEVRMTRYNLTFYNIKASLHVPANATITLKGGFSDCTGGGDGNGTYDGIHTGVDGIGTDAISNDLPKRAWDSAAGRSARRFHPEAGRFVNLRGEIRCNADSLQSSRCCRA